jgi:hypothetical protein
MNKSKTSFALFWRKARRGCANKLLGCGFILGSPHGHCILKFV